MNVQSFLILLVVCSIVTSLVTEVVKKLITDFPTNVIALLVGVFVGIVVSFVYFVMNNIPYQSLTMATKVYIGLLAISSGFGSMLGYDKVIQTCKQIINCTKSIDENNIS